jgi:hypothetical protein
MYMAVLTIAPGNRARYERLEHALVSDILWTAAVQEDGLEHIHSRTGNAGRIELTLFHRGSGAETANAAAMRICLRALTSAPVLSGWQLANW